MALGNLRPWPWEQTAGLDLRALHPTCTGGGGLGTGQLPVGEGPEAGGAGLEAFP